MVTMKMDSLASEQPPEDMVIAPEVEIRTSEVDKERLGIWCKKAIASGSKFGPFLGERVQMGTKDMDPSFVWEIVDLDSKEFLYYINATDPKSGNWMRYINCARYFEEQNIVCQQEGMDIFYQSIKDIQPGEELLTWYEKTPFRKKKTSTKLKVIEEAAPSVKETPVDLEEDDMHTSQRGRRRKVTKYWEMENNNSETSDPPRDSDINSEDDVTMASDDWSVKEETASNERLKGDPHFFQFEVQDYHIVLSRLGRKVFQCDICMGVYRHSFSLKRHYIRNHVNHSFVSKTDLIHCNIPLKKEAKQEEQTKTKEAEEPGEEGARGAENVKIEEEKVDQNSNSSHEVDENGTKSSLDGFPQRMTDLYRCNVCERRFHGVPELKSHLANHPESSTKAFACDKCDMKFTHKQNLMRHAAVHTVLGPKPFVCKFCHKKFSTMTNQKRHERIHQGRRLSCTRCPRTFSQTGDLKKHVKRFHADSFFDCSLCAKYFESPESLADHIAASHEKSHEDDTEAHNCSYCGKSFVTLTSRRRHERVHQGLRMKCTYCKSSFSQTPALKKHMRTTHPEKFHECSTCGRYFSTVALLSEHSKMHGESKSPTFRPDTESDRAESKRLAYHRTASDGKYGCTVCRKHFTDYISMCRHRTLAHQQQLLSSLKKQDIPLRSLFDPDMERNSAFYGRVAQNIADNLRFHMAGTEKSIAECKELIRCYDVEPDAQMEDSSKTALKSYNFPYDFKLQDGNNFYDATEALDEYLVSSGIKDFELQRSVITELESSPDESSQRHCHLCYSVLPSEATLREHVQEQHSAQPPPAHQHKRPMHLLPPQWMPGINPNRIPSLVIPPNAIPPPAHQHAPILPPPCPKKIPVIPVPEEKPVPKISGDDPNPSPKKHICLICFNEFANLESLRSHQEQQHSNVQCKGLSVDLSFTTTWLTRPSAVGLLNISSNQIPSLSDEAKIKCTKCSKSFADQNELHAHIHDCGDYGRNAPRLAYIWYLRGQVITPSKKSKKTGYGKYRRGRNTLPSHKKKRPEDREREQMHAQRRLLQEQDSADEESQRRRRNKQRRDLGTRCFGCGCQFEMASLLELHIPTCPDKDKILGTVANSHPQPDESNDEYEANKHMCIYCERYFTYLKMLRKHVQDVCTKRKELVEEGEYIDEEWEAELDTKTGHPRLSRQSSISSLNGVLAEEDSQDSFDQKRRKKRRRGHNWGYKPKGAKRKLDVEEETPYMIEESFFADAESSASRVPSIDESSNDSLAMKKENKKKTKGEDKEKKKEIKKEMSEKKEVRTQGEEKREKKEPKMKKETVKEIHVDEDDMTLSELREAERKKPAEKKRKAKEKPGSQKPPKKIRTNVTSEKKAKKSSPIMQSKTVKGNSTKK